MKNTAHNNRSKKTNVTVKSLRQLKGRCVVSQPHTSTWKILTGSVTSRRPHEEEEEEEEEEVSMHAITTDGVAENNHICLRKMVLEARAREGERILHAARFQEILTEALDKIEVIIVGMSPNDTRVAKVMGIISRARHMSQEVG